LSTVPLFVPPLRDRGKDIELLFRKFATDFAEKYRVKPITLTEEAKQILLQYRFPGNIRQLKNLADQISVLSVENKEIGAQELVNFLPKESTLPTLYSQGTQGDLSEREILYKILFDLKRDVTDLKKIVLENPAHAEKLSKIDAEHASLFDELRSDIKPEQPAVVLNLKSGNGHEAENETVEDIAHETEDDSLSIEKKEKELIIKALLKNRNKRKYAARDLGISERTLYRKIKQYGLEES
jgi:DNA-binding NtrC family response regulator